jgi:hypothetical protein
MQVYGHLIAADMFGDGYVVPLLDSVDDMKRCLVATQIVLESYDEQEQESISAQSSEEEASRSQRPPGVLNRTKVIGTSGTGNGSHRGLLNEWVDWVVRFYGIWYLWMLISTFILDRFVELYFSEEFMKWMLYFSEEFMKWIWIIFALAILSLQFRRIFSRASRAR